MRDDFKVYKCQIEDNIGNIDEDAITVQWMARWATMSCNYQECNDVKTAYRRQTGRACRSEAIAFGEKILDRESETKNERTESMEIKWR